MLNHKPRADMLSLVPIERLRSARPFSNPIEYCLGDGSAMQRYLAMGGKDDIGRERSDFELFSDFWSCAAKDHHSWIAVAAREALGRLVGSEVSDMSADELWSVASDMLDTKDGAELFSFELDSVGVAVPLACDMTVLPERLGKATVIPVICPFGVRHFDLSRAVVGMTYDGLESALDEARHVAIFVEGFEFEKPNEYSAKAAFEKLSGGIGLSDKERRVLSSQLCRRILLNAAEKGQTVMVLLPSAPDVYSMGEWARLLDYMDITIKTGQLSVTLLAPDAVGLCFASSLVSRYKKITADTGVCGSGCGAPLEEAAMYWGVDKLPLKRASLSSSPAFIGQ